MVINIKSLRYILLAMLVANISHAEIEWNGFLTVGAGIGNPEGDSTLAGYESYEDNVTFDSDTVLGLQLRAPLGDKLSATGQLVARGIQGYELDAAWAYLSYEATDSTTLRLGRLRTPFYLYSDFLEVGYAYHFIAPPADVYALAADSIEGFDIVHQNAVGPVDLTAQLYFGAIDSPLGLSSEADINLTIRDQFGLVLTFEYNWLTIRASHHEAAKVSFNGFENLPLGPFTLGGLADLIESSGPPLEMSFADDAFNLKIDEVKFTFDEIALKIDWNNFLLVAESTLLKSETGPLSDNKRNFVSLGYTIDNVFLHVTQINADDKTANVTRQLDAAIAALQGRVPPQVIQGLGGLAAGAQGLANSFSTPSRTTNVLGVRWDFQPGAAFKVEYLDINDDVKKDASGSLVRFAIDLVF